MVTSKLETTFSEPATLYADDKPIMYMEATNPVKKTQDKPKGSKDSRIAEQMVGIVKEIGRVDGVQRGLRGRHYIVGQSNIYEIANQLFYCVQ